MLNCFTDQNGKEVWLNLDKVDYAEFYSGEDGVNDDFYAFHIGDKTLILHYDRLGQDGTFNLLCRTEMMHTPGYQFFLAGLNGMCSNSNMTEECHRSDFPGMADTLAEQTVSEILDEMPKKEWL